MNQMLRTLFDLNWKRSIDRRKPIRNSRRLKLESLEDRSVPSAVTFLKQDSTTQGNWQGVYGRDGASIAGAVSTYPSYAQVVSPQTAIKTWTTTTAEARAVANTDGGRFASSWQGYTQTISLNMTDANEHQVAFYVLDWMKAGRSESVVATDATTGQTLDSRTIAAFDGGKYLVYNVSGHVNFTFKALSGSSALLSGVLFDPVVGASPPASPPVSPPASPPPFNSAPSISNVGNQTIQVDQLAGPLAFTVSDAETTAGLLSVTATSSNAALVPSSAVTLGGSGGNRTVSISPAAGQSGSSIITLTVTDPSGLSSAGTFTLTVTSPPPPPAGPPTAVFGNTGPLMEGAAGSIQFTQVVDPLDQSLTFSFDFGDDGTYEVTGSSASVAIPANLLADGPWSLPIRGRVTAKDGRFSEYTSIVEIENAAPAVTATGPDSVVLGTLAAFSSQVTDASSVDTDIGVAYVWDFGDGTRSTEANPLHEYTSPGTFTVRVEARDKDGAVGAATMTVVVTDPPPAASTSATFDRLDTTTQGNWPTAYGKDGSAIPMTESAFPDYAQVTVYSKNYKWAGSTNEVRATVNGTGRVSTTWYSGSALMLDVNLTDGQTHTVALYILDWDRFGRSEKVEVIDADTGTVLDSRTQSAFGDGQYLVYTVSGHVQFWITNLDSRYNATVSGIFFGDAYGGTPPARAMTNPADNPLPNSPPPPPSSGGSSGTKMTPGVTVNADWIITPYDKIPNFGGYPTLSSTRSGPWSDPLTWGGRLPVAGDVVAITSGTTVIYDAFSDVKLDAVAIQSAGTLQFRTDLNTRLRVTTLLVLPDGTLTVGTAAAPVQAAYSSEIIINDVPIDTTKDPEQYGHGLIGLGKVTMHGATRSDSYGLLAAEPMAGDTTLRLATPVSGWQVGDRLELSDSQQLGIDEKPGTAKYVNKTELVLIAGISADGRTITLTAPLAYNHPGARDMNGVLDFLPYVANLTRNVVVKSESARGTRGHTLFTQLADVDIRYVQFSALGRSTSAPWDNAKFDAAGNATQVGTNQKGRYSVNFQHLIGPATPQTNGQQFTFQGNSVFCPITPMTFRWGIALNDASFGLVRDNAVYNWSGGGIVIEDAGSIGNTIDANFVAFIRGVTNRADIRGRSDVAHEGSAFWFRGPDNTVTNNVAADSTYGFTYWAFLTSGTKVPAYQGADPAAGQTVTVNPSNIPLRFVNNESYGAGTQNSLTLWSIGTDFQAPYPNAQESVVKDFHTWHVWEHGYFGYETNRVTFDGFVFRNDTTPINRGAGVSAIYFGDYFTKDFTIRNSDIQGGAVGIYPSTMSVGVQTIENSYLRNYHNIQMDHLFTSSYTTQKLGPRVVVVRDVLFESLPNSVQATGSYGTQSDIWMREEPWGGVRNYTLSNQIFVYNYNRQPGVNFQVFYASQASNALLPQTIYNADGTIQLNGAPEAGLTNAESWAMYGVAIAGAVAPDDAISMDKFIGLVKRI